MSQKSASIANLIRSFQGRERDPHYLAYFHCFERQLFFEAHEVLEAVWLPQRQGVDGAFYKGLIQLAGAFVHLQKQRTGPALALFKLSCQNLAKYEECHHGLNIAPLLTGIGDWVSRLESAEASSKEPFVLVLPQLRLGFVG